MFFQEEKKTYKDRKGWHNITERIVIILFDREEYGTVESPSQQGTSR